MDMNALLQKGQAIWQTLCSGFCVLYTSIPFIFTAWRHELDIKAMNTRLEKARMAFAVLPDTAENRLQRERAEAELTLVLADTARLEESFAPALAAHQARLARCLEERRCCAHCSSPESSTPGSTPDIPAQNPDASADSATKNTAAPNHDTSKKEQP